MENRSASGNSGNREPATTHKRLAWTFCDIKGVLGTIVLIASQDFRHSSAYAFSRTAIRDIAVGEEVTVNSNGTTPVWFDVAE